jgi:predicted DNA binding protein
MQLLDTMVRVRHPCPFCEFSGAFPDVEMTLWCNSTSEVLHLVSPDHGTLEAALAAAKRFLDTDLMFMDERTALITTAACMCDSYRDVASAARKFGCWLVPPETYRGGWETHRVISSNKAALRAFVEDVGEFGEVEIVSHRPRDTSDVIHEVGVVPVHFFAGLTDKQVRSLVAAYEEGLLDVPARGDMDSVARRLGISRSTLGEHLRKAQLQIVRNSYDYLRLHEPEGSSGPKVARGRRG